MIGSQGSLGIVIASGLLDTTKYPTNYGTVIKFGAYFNILVCIYYNGGAIWVTGFEDSDPETYTWHQVTLTN